MYFWEGMTILVTQNHFVAFRLQERLIQIDVWCNVCLGKPNFLVKTRIEKRDFEGKPDPVCSVCFVNNGKCEVHITGFVII